MWQMTPMDWVRSPVLESSLTKVTNSSAAAGASLSALAFRTLEQLSLEPTCMYDSDLDIVVKNVSLTSPLFWIGVSTKE
jgi:hypothetical protein